jgi:hypothetical protein
MSGLLFSLGTTLVSSKNMDNKSGPSWDHVGSKSGPSRGQVIFHAPTQLSTQLHKIFSSPYVIRSVLKQVGEQATEQVPATNHREHRGHRGHRDLANEVESTAKVTAGVTAKITAHPGVSKT